jgi:iron transport multicopper oxidase
MIILSRCFIVRYSWIPGINGHFPLPAIEVNLGDTLVVNVVNLLGNETTGIHFHGQR